MSKQVKRVWFAMILHPVDGWIRVGKAYGSRDIARSWIPFVSRAWRGLRTKVTSCRLVYIDGELDEESRRILLDKFNMEAPSPVAREKEEEE